MRCAIGLWIGIRQSYIVLYYIKSILCRKLTGLVAIIKNLISQVAVSNLVLLKLALDLVESRSHAVFAWE
jgi:hypothetical protein